MNIMKNGKKKMRLIDADKITFFNCLAKTGNAVCCHAEGIVSKSAIEMQPTVEAIPVWYIIRWYEKRYKLGSTVADDWERGLLKEKIAEMYDNFKNEKYLDNKQKSERFAQMMKEVIELYNDWEKENERV